MLLLLSEEEEEEEEAAVLTAQVPALCAKRVLADAAGLPVLGMGGWGKAGFTWSNQASIFGHVAEDAPALDEVSRSPALHDSASLQDDHPKWTTAPSVTIFLAPHKGRPVPTPASGP